MGAWSGYRTAELLDREDAQHESRQTLSVRSSRPGPAALLQSKLDRTAFQRDLIRRHGTPEKGPLSKWLPEWSSRVQTAADPTKDAFESLVRTSSSGAPATAGPEREPVPLRHRLPARQRCRYPTPSSPFPHLLRLSLLLPPPPPPPPSPGGGAGNDGGAGARAATGPAPAALPAWQPAVASPGGGEIKPQLLSLLLSRTGPIKQHAATGRSSRETDRTFSRINEKILTDEQLDKTLEKTRINRWDK
jgi:hypothetical protein